MDIRQLRTFRTVAELGSLSKAADRLRIAQPGLSRQIKLLEQELRVQLFVRNGRGMLLTGGSATGSFRFGSVFLRSAMAKISFLGFEQTSLRSRTTPSR